LAEESKGPRWAVATASVLGLGFTPRMPGTVGAAVAIFLYLPAFFIPETLSFVLPWGFFGLALIAAAVSVPKVLSATGLKDPQWVVLDEVAGMMAALALNPPVFARALLCFLLFRLLDILKPFPIDRMEKLPGWWGVVMDDVVTGLLAGLITNLVWMLL